MLELTILSPHRDDAAFSLSVALSYWSKLQLKLKVVNFFTRSEYAPRALSTYTSTVSALRRREDRSALSALDLGIRIEALDLLDAPLRYGVSAHAICRPETAALQSVSEIEDLGRRIRQYFIRGLVLAPLALGDHVDHLAVSSAALSNSVDHKLGFYEDLPYALWTSESALRQRLHKNERAIGVHLRSVVIRNRKFTVAHKRRLISRYRSQISAEEATSIAKYASRYRGGERLWVPRYGSSWNSLVQ